MAAPGESHHLEREVRLEPDAEAVEEILEDDVAAGEGEEAGEEEEESWEREEHVTIGDIMNRAIAEQAFPGGVVAFGSAEGPVFHASFGTYTYDCNRPVTAHSLWDLASLTKIMATVPAAMILYERGLIDLDAPVHRYLPAFGANGKHVVTVRMLLTHTAGLREFHPFFSMQLITKQQVIDFIMADRLWYPPIITTRYSDLSMIVLALVIERITGCHLSAFVHREIFTPLGMGDTAFRPIAEQLQADAGGSVSSAVGSVDTAGGTVGGTASGAVGGSVDPGVVPTEVDSLHRKKLLWGEVHDPTAWIMGGVAGHAGLFATIVDVTKFARCMMAGGADPTTGNRLVSSTTLRLFTTPPPPSDHNPRPFALGWDVAARRGKDGYTSAGRFMGPCTFGHTGFTGTSLWMDPDRNIFVAVLTNAVHPSVDAPTSLTVRDVRPLVANAAVITLGQMGLARRPLMWHLGGQINGHAELQAARQEGEQTVTADDDTGSGRGREAEAGTVAGQPQRQQQQADRQAAGQEGAQADVADAHTGSGRGREAGAGSGAGEGAGEEAGAGAGAGAAAGAVAAAAAGVALLSQQPAYPDIHPRSSTPSRSHSHSHPHPQPHSGSASASSPAESRHCEGPGAHCSSKSYRNPSSVHHAMLGRQAGGVSLACNQQHPSQPCPPQQRTHTCGAATTCQTRCTGMCQLVEPCTTDSCHACEPRLASEPAHTSKPAHASEPEPGCPCKSGGSGFVHPNGFEAAMAQGPGSSASSKDCKEGIPFLQWFQKFNREELARGGLVLLIAAFIIVF